jgi:hypothetical protein
MGESRNFNTSCQRARGQEGKRARGQEGKRARERVGISRLVVNRRRGWAVIWRCESGPRRGGSARLGWPRWVVGALRLASGTQARVLPSPVKRPWPAGRFGGGWHLPAHPLIELIDGQVDGRSLNANASTSRGSKSTSPWGGLRRWSGVAHSRHSPA